jgi:hypothetical protein
VVTALAGCSASRGQDPPDSGSAEQTPNSRPSGFTPGEDNRDPAENIEGVVITEYDAVHAEPGQPVAYVKEPPDGGRHDPVWADCDGVVYGTPVRNEHMVHALEHGAVWIAYHPDQVSGADLERLTRRVDGQPYLVLSPYPTMAAPISLQAWGHQLQLTDAGDPRIDQFIEALRENPYTAPEPGAPCASAGAGFDPANPPAPFPLPAGPGAAPLGGA